MSVRMIYFCIMLNQNSNKMRTLREIAAGFNLYPAESIPQTHLEYFNTRLRGGHKQNEYLSACSLVDGGIFYQCGKDTNYNGEISYYIEHVYEIYKAKDNEILLMLKADNKGKMYLYPHYAHLHKYQGISYHKRNEATKELKEPNKIGVFTDNKVLAHLEYCASYIATMDALFNEVDGENERLQGVINSFAEKMEKQGAKIRRWSGVQVDVETDIFRVYFKIHTDTNYLETKISFTGGLCDIVQITELIDGCKSV